MEKTSKIIGKEIITHENKEKYSIINMVDNNFELFRIKSIIFLYREL